MFRSELFRRINLEQSRQTPVLFSLTMALVAIFMTGCAGEGKRPLSAVSVPYAALPNGHDPLDPSRPVNLHTETSEEAEAGVIPHFERKRGHALNILEISGGGQYGAFGAGFLKGWRESGTRPEFDIVTGVSAGALMATHAFLGTPADDELLADIFTRVGKDDIYHPKLLLGVLFGVQRPGTDGTGSPLHRGVCRAPRAD